jgi:hypothetical protein
MANGSPATDSGPPSNGVADDGPRAGSSLPANAPGAAPAAGTPPPSPGGTTGSPAPAPGPPGAAACARARAKPRIAVADLPAPYEMAREVLGELLAIVRGDGEESARVGAGRTLLFELRMGGPGLGGRPSELDDVGNMTDEEALESLRLGGDLYRRMHEAGLRALPGGGIGVPDPTSPAGTAAPEDPPEEPEGEP